MARTWLQLRVDLLGALGEDLTPAPGRVFIVGPAHSFAALADAINAAFARWDVSHLHEFELAGGRRIGFVDSFDDTVVEDQDAVKMAAAVGPGDEFRFVFDLGDQWQHRCRVLAEKVDPREEWDRVRCPSSRSRSGAGARSLTKMAASPQTSSTSSREWAATRRRI